VSGLDAAMSGSGVASCQVCGRGPTALISVSRGLGLLVVRRSWRYRAPLCRDHGSQLAGNWLIATMLMGWWGLISFFVNFRAIATDLGALRTARRLGPAGSVILPGAFGTLRLAPDAPHPDRVPATQLGLAAAVIGLLVISWVISANFGPKAVGELAVGDCFDAPTAPADIADVPHHPCIQAHTAEVFAIVTYPSQGGASYPTDAAFGTFAQDQCGPAFDSYTGGGGGAASTALITYLLPSADSWSRGDRRLICVLEAPSGQSLSQSLRSPTN
jgi:Septum formation